MGRLILITGGARSGKSNYAEKRAEELGGDQVLYVATSEVRDDEMRERVRRHQIQRPSAWQTIEAPMQVAQRMRAESALQEEVILLDCLTLLTSNVLLEAAGPQGGAFDDPSADPFAPKIEAALLKEVDELMTLSREFAGTMLLVTNEIGLGLVPPYELGRAYRDLLGRANQVVAQQSNEVVLMVSGIALQIR